MTTMMRCRMDPMMRHAMPDRQAVIGELGPTVGMSESNGVCLRSFFQMVSRWSKPFLASTCSFGKQLRAQRILSFIDDVGGAGRFDGENSPQRAMSGTISSMGVGGSTDVEVCLGLEGAEDGGRERGRRSEDGVGALVVYHLYCTVSAVCCSGHHLQ